MIVSNLRDWAIVVWVIMQGVGWFMPDSYGMFAAQSEVAYMEWMERLGAWTE